MQHTGESAEHSRSNTLHGTGPDDAGAEGHEVEMIGRLGDWTDRNRESLEDQTSIAPELCGSKAWRLKEAGEQRLDQHRAGFSRLVRSCAKPGVVEATSRYDGYRPTRKLFVGMIGRISWRACCRVRARRTSGTPDCVSPWDAPSTHKAACTASSRRSLGRHASKSGPSGRVDEAATAATPVEALALVEADGDPLTPKCGERSTALDNGSPKDLEETHSDEL